MAEVEKTLPGDMNRVLAGFALCLSLSACSVTLLPETDQPRRSEWLRHAVPDVVRLLELLTERPAHRHALALSAMSLANP